MDVILKKINLPLLGKMFLAFFKIGAFTIGGGYAMLPLIEKEVVDHQKWVSENDIVDVFAVSQSVPGVIAINSSIFIGYKVAGMPGAISAALGVILPSFFTILIIAFFLLNVHDNIYIQKAFTGVRAGVVGMIGLAAVKLAKSAIQDKQGVIMAIIAFLAIVVFDISVIWIIIAGGIVGYLTYRRKIK